MKSKTLSPFLCIKTHAIKTRSYNDPRSDAGVTVRLPSRSKPELCLCHLLPSSSRRTSGDHCPPPRDLHAERGRHRRCHRRPSRRRTSTKLQRDPPEFLLLLGNRASPSSFLEVSSIEPSSFHLLFHLQRTRQQRSTQHSQTSLPMPTLPFIASKLPTLTTSKEIRRAPSLSSIKTIESQLRTQFIHCQQYLQPRRQQHLERTRGCRRGNSSLSLRVG